MASSKGCHASDVTESIWPTKACSFDFRFRKSQIPIDLSADPVATTYSEAGLKARALMASSWPSIACVAAVVVLDDRVSRIWRVRSSETVPIREACRGWCCTSFTIAV